MDLNFIMEYYVPIVLAASLIIGYVVKRSLNFIPNKYIPLILAVSGAVLGCIANKTVALEPVVYGAFSGLASTGFHQAFTRLVEGERDGKF
ncbi:phage holin family protein [Anaerostipes sp.]|uniref:phage holin family protein n=1 Tax=Anaerostipes sp. TaxID=1872530 RepID=UPI0025BB6370|nr:phage holin family protein [Anaerostipes sp.]MBS7007059.1 phage holin family protein [Anaerostipes sp.]